MNYLYEYEIYMKNLYKLKYLYELKMSLYKLKKYYDYDDIE